MSRRETHDYVLNAEVVDEIIERHHWTHARFADSLGYSRSYWSQLVCGRRRLSARVRQDLTSHELLTDLDEAQLWTRTPREQVS
jgi:plasmid maintenance system antidote protein VapI